MTSRMAAGWFAAIACWTLSEAGCVLLEPADEPGDPTLGSQQPEDDPSQWPDTSAPPRPRPVDGDAPMGDGTGPSDDGDEDEDDGGGNSFIVDPDGGPKSNCDLWEQDCPKGLKCALMSSNGSDLDLARCVEVVPEPAAKGEPCSYHNGILDGQDDCDVGAVCWDLNGQLEGVCVELCSGSAENPACRDPNDVCVGKDFLLCFPRCSPLNDNCPSGCGCYPTDDDFGCFPDASGQMGTQGDPCEVANVCDPGYVCLDDMQVDGCEGSLGCCSAFCDTTIGDCPAPHECVAWFDEGQAPLWYQNLGACVLFPWD